jgi:hypothetical protein
MNKAKMAETKGEVSTLVATLFSKRLQEYRPLVCLSTVAAGWLNGRVIFNLDQIDCSSPD